MTFAIYTLGCKVNTYESEFMTHLFTSKGYKLVDYEDNADIYIINTCTVTNSADNKSKKIIRHTRKNNPNSIITPIKTNTPIEYTLSANFSKSFAIIKPNTKLAKKSINVIVILSFIAITNTKTCLLQTLLMF